MAIAPVAGRWPVIKEVHRHLILGNTDVVDADLSRYFDSIPHSDLLKSVARRVVDRNVLRLIKIWLRAPVEERDADGTRRMSGGKGNKLGAPQGAVVSPLLANIYMNRFVHFRQTGAAEAFRAHVVACARLSTVALHWKTSCHSWSGRLAEAFVADSLCY